MNGRVLLLVMVTGLFMTAWDGDQAAMQAALAKREAAQQTMVVDRQQSREQHRLTALSDAERQPVAEATVRKSGAPSPASSPAKSAEEPTPQDVPLPASIAAGDYQAVDQFGNSVRIRVKSERASSQVTRDFYMADGADGSRWYFVRLLESP